MPQKLAQTETDAGVAMEKLRCWLARRGFALQSRRGLPDEVDLLERVVTINAASGYQARLAALLHECGHVRIFLSRMRRPNKRVFGVSLVEDLGCSGRCDRRGRRARLALLQEEIAAWDSGEQLAGQLQVRFARGKLEKLRQESLMTYVHFTASRMRGEGRACGRVKRKR